jgi:hypothetical protein
MHVCAVLSKVTVDKSMCGRRSFFLEMLQKPAMYFICSAPSLVCSNNEQVARMSESECGKSYGEEKRGRLKSTTTPCMAEAEECRKKVSGIAH